MDQPQQQPGGWGALVAQAPVLRDWRRNVASTVVILTVGTLLIAGEQSSTTSPAVVLWWNLHTCLAGRLARPFVLKFGCWSAVVRLLYSRVRTHCLATCLQGLLTQLLLNWGDIS
jgi:hypothetical protein